MLREKQVADEDLKKKMDQLKSDIEEIKKKYDDDYDEKAKDEKEDEEVSSGLESDNDVDLLVEQEVIKSIKIRKQIRKEKLV